MADRKPLIAGNWKMHLDHLEAIQLVQQLAYHLEPQDTAAVEVAVVPAFTALRSVQTLIEGDRLPLTLGAQDVHPESSGAYTGAVSAPMLARLAVTYVLCGHSERRILFGDDDEVVNRKARAVLAAGMTPIICVGETLDEREAGRAEEVVVAQLDGSLAELTPEQVAGAVVAYEPVWAIGTGKTATDAEAGQMCTLVRTTVADRLGQVAADGVRIQYGGSVKPGNVAGIMRQADIDGALVGGASLVADDFAVICRYPRLG